MSVVQKSKDEVREQVRRGCREHVFLMLQWRGDMGEELDGFGERFYASFQAKS